MRQVCAEAGCANEPTYKGRCPTHARANEHAINRAGKRIYSRKRWQTTRERQLSEHPLCVCGCGRLATDVDHITPLEQGGDPWNPANLRSLAKACHSRVTRAAQLS